MARQLQDLVHGLGWGAIETALRETFPFEAGSLHRYKDVYELLASLPPSSSELVLGIEPHEDSEERWLEVYGEDGTLRDDGEPERFALELSPWSEWLGMGVPEELRRELGDAHVVAHCLYEMTTFGFDEESVRAQREELSRRVRALDEMTPEEREEHLVPWEEVKARLEERLKG